MRAVCFVNRLEFEFGGNVFRSSLTLGDVDNSGEMALVAGNANGDLAVFKGDKQWQIINGLGMITAVGVGDILNCGLNAVVVICGDGWCYIYLCPPGCLRLDCVHVQRIPANTKVLLLGDIDDDGQQELVLGLTDRVVRSYRWCWLFTVTKENILALGKSSVGSLAGRGALVCLNKWEFAHQLGAVTLNHQADGKPNLLVAQPGGTFMKIRCYAEPDKTEFGDTESGGGNKINSLGETSVDYHQLCLNSMRNPNVSTEILGDIETGCKDDKGSPFAVATLDGTLMLVHHDDEILWSYQVDHQLFAVTKLDITGDGHDEIVVCSWDGQTYILDLEKHSVRFQLEETVSGFCSGKYSMEPSSGKPAIPVLVYATFNNKIYIYYDIHLPGMLTENFSPYIEEFLKDLDLQEKVSKISASNERNKYIAELLSPPLTRDKIKKITEISLYFREDFSEFTLPKNTLS